MAPTANANTSAVGAGKVMASTSLHAIPKEDVNRICSGQSVVDLATAVKEMVENALDAGATQIEVKLNEYGRSSVEVCDNGRGIAHADYETLARKHYTSKISRFEDIQAVTSFGFRGEALSSICQLVSSFTVCTRTADDALGTLLTYDRSGQLVSQVPKARPMGTTLVIENLFQPLPVRAKDFHRNIKKHYARLLKVLQAYAISCDHAKLRVSNVTSGKSGASRSIVLATQGQHGMGDNIASVFGTKFFRTLRAVDLDLNGAWPSRNQKAVSGSSNKHKKPAGTQDSSQDDAPNSEGIIDDDDREGNDDDDNEHDDNDQDTDSADSPPVRRIVGFVSKVGEGVGRSDNDRQFFFINQRPFELPRLARAVNDVWRQFEMKQKPACVLNVELPNGEYDVNVTPDKRETFLAHEAHIVEAFKELLTKLYEPSRGTFFVQPLLTTFAKVPPPSGPAITQHSASSEATGNASEGKTDGSASNESGEAYPSSPLPSSSPKRVVRDEETDVASVQVTRVEPSSPPSFSTRTFLSPSQPLHERIATMNQVSSSRASKKLRQSPPDIVDSGAASAWSKGATASDVAPALDDLMSEWSMAEMRHQRTTFFAQEVEREQARQQRRRHPKLRVPASGRADTITDPKDDEEQALAASALQRVLSKEEFKRMSVVGQFNLGFLVGKREDEQDLFIIDQHASDEKFNYETLQRTTVLHQQPLVRPLALELTAGEELVILDHLDVFAHHGFTFQVDKSAQPTKKLRLLSLPFTKHTQFGVDDIRELASLLQDRPLNSSSIRLPKLMAMYASRACRSSVMIGTALHKEEMQRIVHNLSTLEQPWNCPHGRPTLRHLLDLTQLEDD